MASERARRAVLYARVSSADQELGYSIPAQLELLRDYASRHGVAIEREFVEVETAKRAGRTEFGAMLGYLKKHRGCRIVLVEKTDRLSRNFQDMADIEALEIEVHFVKENVILSKDSNSSVKLMQSVKTVFAKNSIDNLSEEVKKGMRTKASQGLWPSYAPLGYRNALNSDQKRIIVPEPVLGPLVTSLFEWYASGEYSLKALAQKAYADGFRFRKSHGKVPVATLHKVLRNPIYMGEFTFGGVRYHGSHEPLVTPGVWGRVQEILNGRRSRKPRKVTHDFPYSGMVRCGHCGCSMVGEVKKGRYVYYHCTGYRGKCGEPYTPEKVLLQQFAAGLQDLALPLAIAQWLEAELEASDQTQRAGVEQAVQRHQTELSRSQHRLDVLYEDRLDGRIDAGVYDRRAQDIREHQQQIRCKIQEAEARLVHREDAIVDVAAVTSLTASLFVDQSAAEQRKLLRLVLQEASWKHGTLQMNFREPFAVLRAKQPTEQEIN